MDRQAARLEIIKVCQQTISHHGVDIVLKTAKRYEEYVFESGDEKQLEPPALLLSDEQVEQLKQEQADVKPAGKKGRQKNSDNDPFA